MPNLVSGRTTSRAMFVTFALAFSLLLLLAACNGDDEASPLPETVVPATATPTATAAPAATATPVPTPTPATVPAIATPTQTDDDDETEAAISSDLVTYTDGLYGYALQVPEAWIGERPSSGLLSIVNVFETGNEDIHAQTIVLFSAEPIHAAEIAQEQITPLAGLSGFRTITEADITLDDGAEAHQVFYGYGTGSNEQRGAVTFVTRGTMAMGVQTQAPRTVYERNFDVLDTVSTSIRPVVPQPFGAPRDETLVLYLDDGPITLDPGVSTDAASSQYIRQIFSGLVLLDEDLIPQPDLATWQVSEDGTVYTFTLKDGAQFHDGTPVTAQDIVFSWERALNRNLTAVGSSGSTYLDDIVGAKAYAAGEADSVTGLEATDDSTLVVTIDEAKSYFISKLTHPSAYLVLESNATEVPDPRLIEEEEEGTPDADEEDTSAEDSADDQDAEDVDPPDPWYYTSIGTGPYRLAHYERSRVAHLTAFEGYVGAPPTVDNLVFRFHAGLPTAMVEEGFIDVTTLIGTRAYDELVEEESALLDQTTRSNALSIQYLAFNTTIAPFDDPDVRRAFLWAVDRKAIFEEHAGDDLRLANGFMPPGLPGYDEDIAEIAYNPVAAKQLLDGTDFGQLGDEQPAIFIVGGSEAGPITRAIMNQWQENLEVRIVYRAAGQAYFYQLPSILEIGFNIYSYGWLADYPDPHNFLDALFHTESANNDGKAGSEAIDELLEQARTAGDDRLEQYRAIERRMVNEAVAIPLYFGRDYILVSERVANLSLDSQGFLRLENVELETEES